MFYKHTDAILKYQEVKQDITKYPTERNWVSCFLQYISWPEWTNELFLLTQSEAPQLWYLMTWHCLSLSARHIKKSKLFPYPFVVYHLKTSDVMCICVFLVLQETNPRGYSDLEFWRRGKSRINNSSLWPHMEIVKAIQDYCQHLQTI